MMRIGFGYDIHRLEPNRPLILGGVTIPFPLGLSGHSDADVLSHAIADALLGALALGDIGQHFPDTSARFKDADSLELLRTVYGLVRGSEYKVVNVDCTVVCERPKLAPHIPVMRQKIAEVLELKSQMVSVKATTNEGMGPEGRGEAISVHAVALLSQSHPNASR